jgi:hypothetical protein
VLYLGLECQNDRVPRLPLPRTYNAQHPELIDQINNIPYSILNCLRTPGRSYQDGTLISGPFFLQFTSIVNQIVSRILFAKNHIYPTITDITNFGYLLHNQSSTIYQLKRTWVEYDNYKQLRALLCTCPVSPAFEVIFQQQFRFTNEQLPKQSRVMTLKTITHATRTWL